ncbi:MAG: hypothetical protein AAFW84_16225 [Cyanobacteria bacterium J06635_15]
MSEQESEGSKRVGSSADFGVTQRGQRLQEGRTDLATRIQVCRDLAYLGRTQTSLFHDCVAILHSALRKSLVNPPELNSHLIEALIHLGAIEAVPAIARAFSTRRVDPSITGSWPLVQAKLGLIPYTAVRSMLSEPMGSNCQKQ